MTAVHPWQIARLDQIDAEIRDLMQRFDSAAEQATTPDDAPGTPPDDPRGRPEGH